MADGKINNGNVHNHNWTMEEMYGAGELEAKTVPRRNIATMTTFIVNWVIEENLFPDQFTLAWEWAATGLHRAQHIILIQSHLQSDDAPVNVHIHINTSI